MKYTAAPTARVFHGADAEYAGKRKPTRKELLLIEMDHVVPPNGVALSSSGYGAARL